MLHVNKYLCAACSGAVKAAPHGIMTDRVRFTFRTLSISTFISIFLKINCHSYGTHKIFSDDMSAFTIAVEPYFLYPASHFLNTRAISPMSLKLKSLNR